MTTPRPRVAYYAHHHGSGHFRHALNIARLNMVELLITGAEARSVPALPSTRYYGLPPDTLPGHSPFPHSPPPFLHYAPTVPAVRVRFAALQRAWTEFSPDVVVVDVSVEVALFARLCGYPVIYRRMPGNRVDLPHISAYGAATGLLAYYPQSLEDPQYLEDFGGRTHYLGMLKPFAPPPLSAGRASRGRTVVVQTSLGGDGPALKDIARAARQCPHWQWDILGVTAGSGAPLPANVRLHGVVEDAPSSLAAAGVIISSAGHNAVAAAAAAGRPVLLAPEQRPFDEQLHFARALGTATGVPVMEDWATVADWPGLLQEAVSSDPSALGALLFIHEYDFRRRFLDLIDRVLGSSGS